MRDKIKEAFPYITEMEIDKLIESMIEGNLELDDVIKAMNGFEDFAYDLP